MFWVCGQWNSMCCSNVRQFSRLNLTSLPAVLISLQLSTFHYFAFWSSNLMRLNFTFFAWVDFILFFLKIHDPLNACDWIYTEHATNNIWIVVQPRVRKTSPCKQILKVKKQLWLRTDGCMDERTALLTLSLLELLITANNYNVI